MDQKTIKTLYFPTKDSSERKKLEELKKRKLVYKVGPRLYTSVPKKNLAATIKSHWAQIVGQLFPDSVLSHRSAIEYTPDQDGFIHLTGKTNRIVKYPGLSLKFHKGPKALATDHDFLNFKAASLERALLENLSVTKNDRTNSGLPIKALEHKLESILEAEGEVGLNKIRDKAKVLAKAHGWAREYEKLNKIIGAFLGTKEIANLKSHKSIARVQGKPYDVSCMEKLEALFAQLKQSDIRKFKDVGKGASHFQHKAFFESYFSNYIERTTFEIEEAEEIVFDKKIQKKRSKDSHDILATFNIVSDLNEIRKTPKNKDELLALMTHRHQIMMAARSEIAPGQFKTKPNRVGETHFVKPELVQGTLEEGFPFYQALPEGFHRAAFMMFLIAEVHPFIDGNGRIARIMMNAELIAANTSTIIIPNVFREDYLLSLRALNRRLRTVPMIKMLQMAYEFSNFDFSDYAKTLNRLQANNWFQEPSDGKIIFG